MATAIRTNNQPRPVLSWYELTTKEQAEFEYMSEADQECAQFMRYRGWVYDLGEFTRAPEDMRPWQGVNADSYFSAILVRFVNYGDSVIAGLALC